MANLLYPKFKQALLNKEVDLDTDEFRVILVDTAQYTYNAAHDRLDDVPAGARIAISNALDSPTITDGVFDVADETITGGISATVEALIVYRHTGTESTSHLAAYIDSGSGLPIPITAGDATVRWNAAGVFSL